MLLVLVLLPWCWCALLYPHNSPQRQSVSGRVQHRKKHIYRCSYAWKPASVVSRSKVLGGLACCDQGRSSLLMVAGQGNYGTACTPTQ